MEFFKGRHTGEAIAKKTMEVVRAWRIERKVVKVITDNAKNMIAAFEKAVLPVDDADQEENSEEDTESEDGNGSSESLTGYDSHGNIDFSVVDEDFEEIPEETMTTAFISMAGVLDLYQEGSLVAHLRARMFLQLRASCNIHSMQLSVKDFLVWVECTLTTGAALKEVRAWVSAAKHSSNMAERFQAASAYMHSPGQTRWDSLLLMMLSVLEASNKIDFETLPLMSVQTPTTAHLRELEDLSSVLQVPRDFTLALEGEETTAGMVIPAVAEVVAALTDIERDRTLNAENGGCCGSPEMPRRLRLAVESR
eukprot:GHVU01191082.1.p1 GENE.GHVU01191082.1~~GHVU01191082.1.p1  ORF type:complete len:309 (+),score=66.58 GHVU01191082.1:1097-2023(+)